MKTKNPKIVSFSFLLAASLLLCVSATAQRPQGIDVSVYQGGCVNWASVKSSGRVFAWAKATEGTGFVDADFYINMTNAQAAGVLIGAYHFARPDVNLGLAGADAEAAYFWNAVKNYVTNDCAHILPALDLEQAPGGSYTKTTMSQWVNRWMQNIVNYAASNGVTVRPIIYTGSWWANPWLDSTTTNWPNWMADYSKGYIPQTGVPNTSPWSNWVAWQCSSTNLVPGVSGNCDENAFNGTYETLGVTLIIGGSNSAPIIGTQPVNTYVATSGTTSFSVIAYGGLPLSYQWQKNGVNLSNGGHYSGVTTSTLTVSSADGTDAASYRCVVSNAYGSKTSGTATLTIITSCDPVALVNGSFEGGNFCGLATGWIGYQRKPAPGTSWSIQTAAPQPGTGLQYQQITTTSSTGGAGVRQDVYGCTVGSTYQVTGWMRGNSGSATCRVKVSPTASTSWSTAVDLNPPQSVSGSTWTAFSGTVVAAAPTMTIWLDGQTGSAGLNKAECFDAISIVCTGAPPTAPTITQQPSPATNCAGTTATFNITATGSSPLSYQWQTNNVNIANNSHYAGCTTATLWITNVSTADARNYRCIVSNSAGTAISSSAALTVKTATIITQQPFNATIPTGGTTNFTVTATGDGTLTYQWQKNSVNLNNGGHYSGATTATLTISTADASDAANYRCVVTGGCGSSTSFQATLTVSGTCTTPMLLNPSFELSNISGVATNWTGYQRSPNPTTVWSIQTASPPAGGGLQYQQIANTSSTGGGGVRQDVTGCTIGATYTVAGWMRGNSGLYSTCTVKVSPAASTSWATAVNLNPPQTYTGNTWTPFSGTVVATGTTMTIWLDGTTGSTGQNKAECFDAITVTCTP